MSHRLWTTIFGMNHDECDVVFISTLKKHETRHGLPDFICTMDHNGVGHRLFGTSRVVSWCFCMDKMGLYQQPLWIWKKNRTQDASLYTVVYICSIYYVYIYIYIYTPNFTYKYIYIYIWLYTCLYIHMCIYIYMISPQDSLFAIKVVSERSLNVHEARHVRRTWRRLQRFRHRNGCVYSAAKRGI